jgi:hypothetical protein
MFSPNGKPAKLILAVTALAAFAQPTVASAATCETLMSNINTWASTQPQGKGTYQILTRVTVLRSDGTYAGYAEGGNQSSNTAYAGILTYHPSSKPTFGLPFPAYLQDPNTPGTPRGLTAYFSDRRYSNPCPTSVCLNSPSFPFNAAGTDRQGVYVQLQDSFNLATRTTIPAGAVTFTLYSWGNAQYPMVNNACTVNGDGKGGLVYGFVPTGSGDTELVALSLNESYVPPPPPIKLRTHQSPAASSALHPLGR